MTRSAIAERRERTSRTITLCAQRLADERGLDGFTMDDLAAEAGVSRRTLFNYFPGKLDAVLGEDHEPDPELFATFAAGGPTGDLFTDLRVMTMATLEAKSEDADAESVARVLRLMRTEARVFHAVQERFRRSAEEFSALILSREGAAGDALRAQVATTLLFRLFEVALDNFVADPATPLVDHVTRAFDAAHALLG